MDLGISKLVWSIVEKDVTFLQSIVCLGVHELVNVERGLIKRVYTRAQQPIRIKENS